MYGQDWMCTEYDSVDALQQNLTLADAWLKGMNAGAAAATQHGAPKPLTIQYCMPYPNDLLAAAAHSQVCVSTREQL